VSIFYSNELCSKSNMAIIIVIIIIIISVPLAIPTFDFSFMYLAFGIYTTDGN